MWVISEESAKASLLLWRWGCRDSISSHLSKHRPVERSSNYQFGCVERKRQTLTVFNKECEVGSASCAGSQAVDKLVRSLLHSENPYGNCAVCLHVSAVQDSAGEQELHPAGRTGLRNAHACYQFFSRGAVRCVTYLRSNCNREKKDISLSVPSRINCTGILTDDFKEWGGFLLLPSLVRDATA